MRITDPDRQLKRLNLGLHALGLVSILVGIGMVQGTVFGPMDERYTTFSKQASETEPLLRDAERVWAEHKAIKQRLAQMEAQSAAFLERIPSQPREEEFLAQVARAAQESGLQVRDYRPGTANRQGSFGEWDATFSFEGDYEALCGFFDKLPKLQRPSRLERLEVTVGEQGMTYGVNLSLVASFQTSSDADVAAKEARDGEA